tara:strand:- start:2193 stop:4046 length:1854 start_codon:yes stop_codon:yes gene_type:complete
MPVVKEKISAVIITYNEIDYIKQCVRSVSFADEILVVDSFSDDGTYEFLLQHPNIKALQHPFENFTQQKSFALEQASHDWILFLDADEVVPERLKTEILATINSANKHVAYWFYRTFMFKNEKLLFSGWQTDKNYRLFRKSKAKFSDKKIVHETLGVNGTSGILKEKLIHYCYKDYDDYKGKMLRYGRLRAIEENEKGKKWSIFLQYLRPLWKFTNHYLIRLGFLDGKKGVIISYLNALGVYERYRELKRLQITHEFDCTNYRFLIYISYSYGFPIGKPLYEEILKRGYDVKWFLDSKEAQKKNTFSNATLNSVNEVLDYKPHIVLAATNQVPDFFPGLKVQIFHGFNADKRNFRKGHFRIRGFFDLYCTQGPSTTRIFKEKQKEHPHFEVIETGWSKMDAMFPVPEKVENQRNTILIASTFTKKLSLAFDEELFNKIKTLSEKGIFKFLQILHPKLQEDIKSKWKSLQGGNFHYYDTTDIIPLLHQADILLSDTSSVIQEFLLQRKPVVTFRHKIPQDYIINVNEVSQIEDALSYALTYPPKKIEHISKYAASIHPYNDGHSSSRIIDASILFLHKDKSYLKNKPINLARKLKIRIKLGYFTIQSFSKPFTLPENQ